MSGMTMILRVKGEPDEVIEIPEGITAEQWIANRMGKTFRQSVKKVKKGANPFQITGGKVELKQNK